MIRFFQMTNFLKTPYIYIYIILVSHIQWNIFCYIYMYIYIYNIWYMEKYRLIRHVSWVFAKIRETWVQFQVMSYQRLKKVYLIPSCLTLSNIRCVSRVKWSNPGKGVALSPTPRCSSYWKGSLQVALDYSHQLYLLIWRNIRFGKSDKMSKSKWKNDRPKHCLCLSVSVCLCLSPSVCPSLNMTNIKQGLFVRLLSFFFF